MQHTESQYKQDVEEITRLIASGEIQMDVECAKAMLHEKYCEKCKDKLFNEN